MSEQVENQPKSITPRVIVVTLIVVVGIPFLPLLISRQWDWWEAWVYAFISIFGFAISRELAARRHPDLLAERARFLRHEDAKTWDKYLAPMVRLGSGLILIVVGLDALNDWSPAFSLLVKTLALFAILAGYALGTLALMENRFFSGIVRIQSERGHHVVSSGPYGCIRDPGYAGALMNLGQRLLITIFVILTLGAITACRESHSSPALPRQDAVVTPDQVVHIGADDQATPTDIPLPDVIRPPAELWRDPVPTAALEAARSLASARYYRQDPIDVVYRFQNQDLLIPKVTRQEPWGFQIGDSHVFWVEDKVSLEQYQVKADLVYETSHAYYFVEEGVEVNGRDLGMLAEHFETRIYPTTRSFLGQEWSPGVDGDPHLVFLLVGRLGGGVGGYHDDRDGYSQLVYPLSNEMEMIYLSANGLTLDSPATECLLAHEFQHLIRWAVDQDEEIWLNEAFGELACSINDLAPHYRGRITNAFASYPDIQLNGWTRDRKLVEAQYGASYLFITYFHDRFGDEALRALSDHPANGLQGIDQTLDSLDRRLGAQ
jgi:protein-S-isoprenylcysteine O-methyltransferase Ste14